MQNTLTYLYIAQKINFKHSNIQTASSVLCHPRAICVNSYQTCMLSFSTNFQRRPICLLYLTSGVMDHFDWLSIRLQSMNIQLLKISTSHKSHSFKISASTVWNTLSTKITAASSVNNFKSKPKRNLFCQLYDTEDSQCLWFILQCWHLNILVVN